MAIANQKPMAFLLFTFEWPICFCLRLRCIIIYIIFIFHSESENIFFFIRRAIRKKNCRSKILANKTSTVNKYEYEIFKKNCPHIVLHDNFPRLIFFGSHTAFMKHEYVLHCFCCSIQREKNIFYF